MKKKLCSLLLAVVLLAGLLPVGALAGEASWAEDAVSKLNGIYGSDSGGPFSTDDTAMTVGDLKTLMNTTGWQTDKVGSGDGGNLSRGTACDVLADVFDLPVPSGTSAIKHLYEQNIVNGVSENNLNETGNVSKAEFAVLTYRVLNAVGGGLGSSTALKPGTEEYFAWMYLAARRCVAFQSDKLDTAIESVTGFTTYAGIDETAYTDDSSVVEVLTGGKDGEDIWKAWVAALSEPRIGGLNNFGETYSDRLTYNGEETMKAAAARLMGAFIEAYTAQKGSAPTIFTDVTMNNWWYDGVMYSFDASYINGLGNGTFEPTYRLPLYEFAVLLYRINPVADSELTDIALPFLTNGNFSEYEQNVMSNEAVQKAMKAAVKAGYLSWADGGKEDFDPTETVARGDAIADILKACVDGKNVSLDLSKVNTSILDRFTDTNGLSETQKQYLAYAVSCGMVNGTSSTTLAPNDPVSRADAGVLLYRMLIGLDTSKMHDYEQSVQNALGTGSASTASTTGGDEG